MLAGAWSRRITEEHRLVYLVDEDDSELSPDATSTAGRLSDKRHYVKLGACLCPVSK